VAPANLPDRIIRLLSFHGPVEVWTGRGDKARTAKVHLAPFDDELVLLVPMSSPLVPGLLQTCRAVVTARAEDQHYTLRLEGRAVAGRPVSVHPNRNAISPWLPEGERPHRLLAVPFVAETVELVEDDGQVRNRFAGPTPAGKAVPGPLRRWLSAALGGGGRLPAVAGLVGTFLWFGYLGSDYPWRPVALLLAWTATLGLVGGIRLLGQAVAFGHWREGHGELDRIPSLRDGEVAPDEARLAGFVALGLGMLALGCVAAFPRGMATLGVILGCSGAPLLAVVWLLHSALATRGGEKG